MMRVGMLEKDEMAQTLRWTDVLARMRDRQYLLFHHPRYARHQLPIRLSQLHSALDWTE
jgi:hypothetical protein